MKTLFFNKRSQFLYKQYKTIALLFVATFCAYAPKCLAQGYSERLTYSAEYMPLKIKDPAGDQKFSGADFKLSGLAPVFLNTYHTNYLLVGGNFEVMHFWCAPANTFPVNAIYSISPTLGYGALVAKNLTINALLIPFLNTDFINTKGGDIRFGALLRSDYRVNQNLALRATLGYRNQFYGPQYIVLLGVDWKISDKWRFYGDAPSTANLNLALCKTWNTGFNLTANNTSYALRDEKYLKFNNVQPGLYAETIFCKNWALRGTVSYSIQRNLDIYNRDDKNGSVIDFITLGSKPTPLNTPVSKGPAFKMGISYRIPEQVR